MANQNKNKKSRQGRGSSNAANKVSPLSNLANRRMVTRPSGPRFSTVGGNLVVRNKEMLFNIFSGSATDSLWRVGLNPVDSGVFSWLSGISDRYTYYRWKKLRILYSSTCPTTQRGAVAMGLFYDKEDLDAWFLSTSNLQNLTQTVGSTQGPCWGSTITCHPNGDHTSEMQVCTDIVRAHMRTPWHLIDHSTVGTALDNQSVAVFLGLFTEPNTVSSGAGCGTVWLDYEIEFCHPTAVTANIPGTVARSVSGGFFDPTKDIRYVVPIVPNYPPYPDDPVSQTDREVEA